MFYTLMRRTSKWQERQTQPGLPVDGRKRKSLRIGPLVWLTALAAPAVDSMAAGIGCRMGPNRYFSRRLGLELNPKLPQHGNAALNYMSAKASGFGGRPHHCLLSVRRTGFE